MENQRVTPGFRGNLPKDAEQSRIIPFTLSTYARDRFKFVLNQAGWKLDNFRKNPTVGYMHSDGSSLLNGPDPDYIIGQGIATQIEGSGKEARLVDKLKFDPADVNLLAEKIFRKVLLGTLNGCSVMFNETGPGRFGTGEEAKGQIRETYYTSGQELLEWSIVNICGNPEAVKRNMHRSVGSAPLAAMMYAFHELGRNFTFRQVKNMKVRDVLDILNARDLGIKTTDTAKARRLSSDPVALKEVNERIEREQKEFRVLYYGHGRN